MIVRVLLLNCGFLALDSFFIGSIQAFRQSVEKMLETLTKQANIFYSICLKDKQT